MFLTGDYFFIVGTNDCYATIQLGKEKYHTSIKEKSLDPEWNEECDLYVS